MTIFKSWLIANYENVMAIILIALFEVFLFTSDIVPIENRKVFAGYGALMLLMGIGIIGGAASRSTLLDIFNLLIIVIAYIIVFCAKLSYSVEIPLWILMISLFVSCCMAIGAVLFTVNHINDVLSRRMLYFNSNVSLFEITWKYAFNRFVVVFNNTTLLFCMLVLGYYYHCCPEKILQNGYYQLIIS